MVAEVCHEYGVACLMNGDVENRDEGLKLAEEFGADGAMIATAAEKNPSCFRSQVDGGLAPWEEVVDHYVKTAIDVDNRFGNSKFLLAQMVPGKSKFYQPVNQCKNYRSTCEALGLDKYMDDAIHIDAKRGLDQPLKGKAAKKAAARANASALAAGGQSGRSRQEMTQKRKKALSERKPATLAEAPEVAQVASAEVA